MLIETITNSREYREYRQEIKEAAEFIGWRKFKEDFQLKNKRKRYFHVIETILNVPLYLKRETERYYYFDIVTNRACRFLPQLKIEKCIFDDVKSNLLKGPVYISIQNEFCLRGTKFFDGNFFIEDTTQIYICRQKKQVNLNCALKFILVGPYSGKNVLSGAWETSNVISPKNALYKKCWTASSLTGAHWEDFYLYIIPVDSNLTIKHIGHGKKRPKFDLEYQY